MKMVYTVLTPNWIHRTDWYYWLFLSYTAYLSEVSFIIVFAATIYPESRCLYNSTLPDLPLPSVIKSPFMSVTGSKLAAFKRRNPYPSVPSDGITAVGSAFCNFSCCSILSWRCFRRRCEAFCRRLCQFCLALIIRFCLSRG